MARDAKIVEVDQARADKAMKILQQGESAEKIAQSLEGLTLMELEKAFIQFTLERCEGNRRRAAAMLGIYRPTLYSKMRKYRINVPSYWYYRTQPEAKPVEPVVMTRLEDAMSSAK